MAVHYVKNADLRNEIIKCKKEDKLSDDAIIMLQKIATKFSRKLNYIYEEDREDCIAFAVMDCYQYWRGYDPEKSTNAFAYFTTIIKNGFAKGWRKVSPVSKASMISLDNSNIYNF